MDSIVNKLSAYFSSNSFDINNCSDKEALTMASIHKKNGSFGLAMEIYLKLMEFDHHEAPALIMALLKGPDGTKNQAARLQAFNMCDSLTKDGRSKFAPQYLGLMYEKGYGVEKSEKMALTHYRAAYTKGVEAAASSIAELYEKGSEEINQDYESAVYNYQKADALNVPGAAYKIACIYRSGGFGVERDYAQALDWYIKAYGQKDSEAEDAILSMCLDGSAFQVNPKYALELLTTVAKSDHRAADKLKEIMQASAQRN